MAICRALLPLDGCTIGVTADRRAEEQAELLRRLGADVVIGSALRILTLEDADGLRSATRRLLDEPPHIVIATTGIGIRTWIDATQSWGMHDAVVAMLRTTEVWARGPKAHAALVQLDIEPAYREPTERLDALIEVMILRGRTHARRIGLQLYGAPVPWAVEQLTNAGAKVVEAPIYRSVMPENHRPVERIVQGAVDGRLDAVTFTSPQTIRNFLEVADDLGVRGPLQRALDRDVIVACVGPVSAETATGEGVPVHAAPGTGRLGLMVRSLTEVVRARHLHVVAPTGDEVVCQGALLLNGAAARATLSPRERAVLRCLLERPGGFVAKPTLLREAWRHEPATEGHALDAVVGRLRRELAIVGLEVVARARRGYMLNATQAPCAAASTSPGLASSRSF